MKDCSTHFASVIWCDFWAKQDIQQEKNVGRDFYPWDLAGSLKVSMKNGGRQLGGVGFEKKSLQRWSTNVLCTKDQESALRRLIGSFLALCWRKYLHSWTPAKLFLSLSLFKYSYSNSVIWRDAYIIILACAVGPNNGIFCKVLVSGADNLQKLENSIILSIGSFIA